MSVFYCTCNNFAATLQRLLFWFHVKTLLENSDRSNYYLPGLVHRGIPVKIWKLQMQDTKNNRL